MRRVFLVALLAWSNDGLTQGLDTVGRTTTLAALFPAEEARALASTIAVDKPLRYRVRLPQDGSSSGVLVFVKPIDSGEVPEGWRSELDRRNLIWIAAEDYGNEHPRAQRILAAIAGLKLIENTEPIDKTRVYIGGMSGGGRIASQVISHFPRRFSGALYIVGADFWTSAEEPLRPRIAANRYVFVTGSRDFNHRDMRRVYEKYQAAGAARVLFMDLAGFGHEYPEAAQLGVALDYLDAR